MGILINTGFDVGSSNPIDSRTVKNTIDERNVLISDGLVYENLKVYCKDTQTEYRWTGTEWETVGSSGGTAIDDAQASDTTTYSSNKITDLITEATAGKDFGNLLIVNNASEMSILATKDNLGKSALYVGDDTGSYTKGETYELYWNAITIKYLSFAYSPIVKFNFTKIQGLLGDRTSLTVTGEYGYQGQATWNITTNIGMSGGGIGNYGITSPNGVFTVGDKFSYTYDNSNKDSYTWIPVYTKPSRILSKEWYNIDTPIIYDGVERSYKRGRIYKLSSDNITISSSNTEISNLTIDKKKFINNCNLRGIITFNWNSSGKYFTIIQDYDSYHTTQYTKEQLNNWGITYSGDITTDGSSIVIKTSKDSSISNWVWKDVTDIVEVPTKTSELTNDSNYVKATELSTVATSGSYNDLTDKPTIPTKTSELTNDSNFVVLNDTQASATTTYSSNKITDLITKATAGKNTIEHQIEDALNCIDIKNHALRLVIVSKDYETLVFRGKTYNCYDSIAVAINTEYETIESSYQLGLAVIVMEGTYTECIRLHGKKNISIVGVNKYKCKIVNKETDTENGYQYPPLWINPSTTVMNLTIQCTTSRGVRNAYCIHTDDDGTGKVLIKNCILHCSQHACIGFGTRQDAPLFIEDCDMINDYSDVKGVLLYGHNDNAHNTTREEVHITRCYGRTAFGQPLDLFNANWYYPTGARGSLPWLLYFNDNTFYFRNIGIPTTITVSTEYTGESKDTINFISGGMMRMPSNSGNNIATLNYPYQNAIENIPPTSIEFNTKYITKTSSSISMYEIRNGICYVTMDVTSVVSADSGVVCALPKPSSQMQFTIPPFGSQSTNRVGAILFATGKLSFFALEKGQRYMLSFSYPVAEQ